MTDVAKYSDAAIDSTSGSRTLTHRHTHAQTHEQTHTDTQTQTMNARHGSAQHNSGGRRRSETIECCAADGSFLADVVVVVVDVVDRVLFRMDQRRLVARSLFAFVCCEAARAAGDPGLDAQAPPTCGGRAAGGGAGPDGAANGPSSRQPAPANQNRPTFFNPPASDRPPLAEFSQRVSSPLPPRCFILVCIFASSYTDSSRFSICAIIARNWTWLWTIDVSETQLPGDPKPFDPKFCLLSPTSEQRQMFHQFENDV